MIEGKIIKFYRELQDLMQKDLGEGICSTTHISKIERGLTEVSEETLELLAKRLCIDLKAEMNTYFNLDLLLKEWHESIILKLNSKAECLKKQLENIALLQLPDFYCTYKLTLTRYYLLIGDGKLAQSLIKEMNCWKDFTKHNQNMLLHIKGKFFLDYEKEYNKAISYLKKIDLTYYNNPEYYYDLAIAYHCMNSRVLAYFYANKALHFFTKSHSFTRIIETEMMMLIQVEQEEYFDPKDSGYPRLIEMADNLGLDDQKAKLLHNYAYHNFRYGYYEKAFEYYGQAMKIRKPSNLLYLASLEGHLNAATKIGVKSDKDLLQLAMDGFSLSNKLKDTMYKHYFQLHIYRLQNQKEQYYDYLETEAYPYFKEMGYGLATEHYEIKLLDFYLEKGEMEQANKYALSFVEKHRKNSELI